MLAFVAAYTEECCKPKHHFRLHVIEDYWKRRQLFDCVALERKHRLAKAEIEARGNNLSAQQLIDASLRGSISFN